MLKHLTLTGTAFQAERPSSVGRSGYQRAKEGGGFSNNSSNTPPCELPAAGASPAAAKSALYW